MASIELTEEQKKIFEENYQNVNLSDLTVMVFGDPKLDGRTRQGRFLNKLIKDRGEEAKTSKWEKRDEIELTDDQKEFIEKNGTLLSSVEIAQILFPEAMKVKSLTGVSKEAIAVQQYLKDLGGDYNKDPSEELAEGKYFPPLSVSRVYPKVMKYINLDLRNHTDRKTLDCMNSLMRYLNDFRFCKVINDYRLTEDRELFEATFVSNTWDKPDLTQSDVQSYITLSINYVVLQKAHKQKAVLDAIFQDSTKEENPRISMSLAEMMDKIQKVYDSTETKIRTTIKELEGTRNERNKNKIDASRSILVLVEAFMMKQTREEMLKIAEYEKKLVKDEVDRIERASDFTARLFGASKKELIGG